MTIELYLDREFETAHEMQALGQFLTRMLEVYGRDDTTTPSLPTSPARASRSTSRSSSETPSSSSSSRTSAAR